MWSEINGLIQIQEKLSELYKIIIETQGNITYETASVIVEDIIEKIKYLKYVKENW